MGELAHAPAAPRVSAFSLFEKALIPFRLVFIMWLVFVIQFVNGYDLSFLGVKPRTVEGLIGIFTAPMVHADLLHLLGNTLPVLFLGSILFYFYGRVSHRVFFTCYLLTNLLVWLFSPNVSYHIGASGLVYGLSAFLILFGVFRKQVGSLLISLGVFLAYGGIFYGIVPTRPDVSWESHLAGALVGISTAIYFRRK
jgi:membrane associated rhomboid family serine protease